MLNGGRTFAALWKGVQTFVDPRTAAKLRVCPGGAAQLAVLRSLMPDDVIPARYGGSRPERSSAEDHAGLDAWLAERRREAEAALRAAEAANGEAPGHAAPSDGRAVD